MGIAERKERERLVRREQILEAAYQLFHETGFSAATMDQIAERAELAKGTLYLYFKSKEEVYYALLDRGLEIICHMEIFQQMVMEIQVVLNSRQV